MSDTAASFNRRHLMTSGHCVITATNDEGGIHKVQIKPTPRELIDDVPVAQLYGLSGHAPIGSEAHMVCVTGDRSKSVVVATNNPDARPRNLKSGEVALYDNAQSMVKLANGGSIEVSANKQTTITAPEVKLGAGAQRSGPGNVQLDNSNLTLAFPPSDTMHATTKAYVDSLHGGGGTPGPPGPQGPPGTAATINVGTTTTGAPGSNASVVNSGNSSAAVFNFTIPRGDVGAQGTQGSPGAAATITVGTTTTGAPGSNASVTNSGNSSAAVFNFTIPRGDVGAIGPPGADSTVPGPPGADSTVPGPPGPQGPPGATYTLPIASTSVLGGVMVDGSTITISASGVLSAHVGRSIWDAGLAADTSGPDPIAELQAQIADLTARLAALEARA